MRTLTAQYTTWRVLGLRRALVKWGRGILSHIWCQECGKRNKQCACLHIVELPDFLKAWTGHDGNTDPGMIAL